MDKRKKRTSINQYLMYIELLEKDEIFRSGAAPRDAEPNYINNKWRELAAKLNTCPNGPQLSPDEWKKRLNDWKNSTRCKYRRSISGERDISMSPLEVKALSFFGKTPVLVRSTQTLEFKSEAKALFEAEKKHQKAAKEKEGLKNDSIQSMDEDLDGILLDDEEYNEEDSVEEIEFEESKLQLNEQQTNGGIPKNKRRRTIETTVYEIKSILPKNVVASTTQTTAAGTAVNSNNIPATKDQPPPVESLDPPKREITINTSGLELQLKRIADVKEAKLQFEIAKYKFNNPGFEYSNKPL